MRPSNLDNRELNEIMKILEELENEDQAVCLLKEFNNASALLGRLLLNDDPGLDHHEWKKQCDQAQVELDKVVASIRSLG